MIEKAIHGFFTNSKENRSLMRGICFSRKVFAINLVNKSRKMRERPEAIMIRFLFFIR